MAVDIRPIREDELAAWGESLLRTFHVAGVDAEAAAATRRAHLEPGDLERMVGAFEDGRIVATFRSFSTRLTLPGGTTARCGGVTAVTVSSTHRRRGLLSEMMARDLRLEREQGELASILVAAEYPIYGRFGYGHATDQATWTFMTARSQFARPVNSSPEQVEILPPADARPILPEVFETHRSAQPGEIDRRPKTWDIDLGLTEWPGHKPWKGWIIVHRSAEGRPDGYLRYHVEEHYENRQVGSILFVDDLIGVDPDVEAALWRFAFDMDLVATVTAENRRVDEPVVWRLADGRAATQSLRADFMWLRPLDVEALLQARSYGCDGRLVFEVVDEAGYASGRFALDATTDGARCRRTQESPGLRLPVSALGSVVLGGVPLRRLAQAGRLDALAPDALRVADRLFWWPEPPWCSTWF